ncbi:hypothetical protein [Histophilus somni]|nr:hypothetical protein [Histophilus somni]
MIIGYQAQSKAEGGVAIGESAVVETAAGDSIAFTILLIKPLKL